MKTGNQPRIGTTFGIGNSYDDRRYFGVYLEVGILVVCDYLTVSMGSSRIAHVQTHAEAFEAVWRDEDASYTDFVKNNSYRDLLDFVCHPMRSCSELRAIKAALLERNREFKRTTGLVDGQLEMIIDHADERLREIEHVASDLIEIRALPVTKVNISLEDFCVIEVLLEKADYNLPEYVPPELLNKWHTIEQQFLSDDYYLEITLVKKHLEMPKASAL